MTPTHTATDIFLVELELTVYYRDVVEVRAASAADAVDVAEGFVEAGKLHEGMMRFETCDLSGRVVSNPRYRVAWSGVDIADRPDAPLRPVSVRSKFR